MAELIEEAEGRAEAAPEQSAAAVALALGRTSSGGDTALDTEAAGFLRDQRRLVNLQSEHLHEQRELMLSRLRWGRFSDRVKAALQLMTAAVGLVVVVLVAVMAWQAYEDQGAVIDAFTVPPDLAQRGLTGQVVASKLLDRLSELQAQTVTGRPASTYANDWGSDIKVEIPETGVSIGELNRYLRAWLGSETRISGEVVRTPSGLALTARASGAAGSTFQGADADLDKLVQQAAEAVYARTQPYRYAVYLSSRGRTNEAIAAFSRLARSGPAEDRAWAYTGWASILFQQGRYRESGQLAGTAIRLNPRLQPAYPIRGLSLSALGQDEADLAHARRELTLLRSGRAIGLPAGTAATRARIRFMEGTIAGFVGDFRGAAASLQSLDPIDFEGAAQGYLPEQLEANALASDHDISGARRLAAGLGVPGGPPETNELNELYQKGDWSGLAHLLDRMFARGFAPQGDSQFTNIASAYAHAGRLSDAEAWISRTSLDCYPCLSVRGFIASRKQDRAASDRWYAEADRLAPSIPFADNEWAQVLLAEGDVEGAIAKATEAHRRSPHFADPLELWSEALLQRRDLAGAVAKFAEADNYAPRWGRNHMMWGEALMLQGRYRDARAQYEAARGLDLTTPERAALDVLLARTANGPLHG